MNNQEKHSQSAPAAGAQIKMHEGEIDIDLPLVQRLLTEQFPQLAQLPIALVRSTGTVNAIYRLGADLYVRLPRLGEWAEGLQREMTWLPQLAPQLSLKIPQPLAEGKPTTEFPYPWAIYQWLEGAPYQDDLIKDERQAARDLANFILELRNINPQGAPQAGRAPLITLDETTRAAIEASRSAIDTKAMLAAWENALESPSWDGKPVWLHGDLLKSNLLVQNGRLSAIIDFGGAGIGDPAMDVVPAWSVFNRAGREVFRQALNVDHGTWRRARGYALHQALLIIPYYPATNPEFVTMAKRTVEEVLAEFDHDT